MVISVFLLGFLVLLAVYTQWVSGDCENILNKQIICIDKVFQPEDILHELTYSPVEINFIKIINGFNLKVPEKIKDKRYQNAIYKQFSVTDSCVTDIEVGFFNLIDNKNSALEDISFKNVSCLTKLSAGSFQGIGNYIKTLTFESMKDLTLVEESFFNSLVTLERFTLVNTGVMAISRSILTMTPKLTHLNLSSNQLALLPWVPEERRDLVDKIYAYNNPFDCQCSSLPYVDAMRTVLSIGIYVCASPPILKGQPLALVELCKTEMVTKKMGNDTIVINTASTSTQIIIAISMVVLTIGAIIAVVVIYKRCCHRTDTLNRTTNEKSSTKIIFENDGDSNDAAVKML